MPESSASYRNDGAERMDGALINALSGLGTTRSKIENTRIGYNPYFVFASHIIMGLISAVIYAMWRFYVAHLFVDQL